MVAKMLEEQVAAWRAGGNLEFFDRLRSESKARLLEHTVPIYRCIEGGVPIAHGSGVLLRIAGVPFLLSCAHVLQDAAQPNTMLFVDGPVGGALIPLRGTEFHRTTEPGVDLGFALLTTSIRDALSHKKFLGLEDVEPDPVVQEGWYSVLGFPVETTKRVPGAIGSVPFSFSTPLYSGRLDDHIDGFTIALKFDTREIVDETGIPQRTPHPGGISGCGIWRLYGFGRRAIRPEDWSADDIKLVGIQHGFIANKAMKGTLVTHAVGCIARAYPELAVPIGLVRLSR